MKANKIQSTGYRFFIVLLVVSLSTVICPLSPTLAQTPTASPSVSIQTKLKALQDEIASKAAQIKSQVAKSLQDRAFLGTLKSQDGDHLLLDSKTGERKIKITQDTIYQDLSTPKSKKKFSKDTLETGIFLVALGDLDDSQTLIVKKLVKHNLPVEGVQVETFWGEVISATNTTLTIEDKDKKTQDFLIIKGSTVNHSGGVEAKISDLKPGFIVSVVTDNKTEEKPKIRFIYVYSGLTFTDNKPASPSATPKPTTSKITPTKAPVKPKVTSTP